MRIRETGGWKYGSQIGLCGEFKASLVSHKQSKAKQQNKQAGANANSFGKHQTGSEACTMPANPSGASNTVKRQHFAPASLTSYTLIQSAEVLV